MKGVTMAVYSVVISAGMFIGIPLIASISDNFDLIIAQDGNKALSYLFDTKNISIFKQGNLPMILLLDLNLMSTFTAITVI
jgi:hypothetical protein